MESSILQPAKTAELWRSFLGTAPGALLAHFSVYEPPVPIEAIARALGVEVRRFFEATNWSGALDHRYGSPIIWVRGLDWETRQRFTIAHEIGHLLLHDGQQVLWRDTTYSGDWRESQANNFAAELLMPAHMVFPRAANEASVRRLANTFEVSVKAMEYRLINLGLRR